MNGYLKELVSGIYPQRRLWAIMVNSIHRLQWLVRMSEVTSAGNLHIVVSAAPMLSPGCCAHPV